MLKFIVIFNMNLQKKIFVGQMILV